MTERRIVFVAKTKGAAGPDAVAQATSQDVSPYPQRVEHSQQLQLRTDCRRAFNTVFSGTTLTTRARAKLYCQAGNKQGLTELRRNLSTPSSTVTRVSLYS